MDTTRERLLHGPSDVASNPRRSGRVHLRERLLGAAGRPLRRVAGGGIAAGDRAADRPGARRDRAENPEQLRGVLPKIYARAPPQPEKLGQLVSTVAKIGFDEGEDDRRDILGRTYEYFIRSFARSEGHRGGEFFTPRSVTRSWSRCSSPSRDGCWIRPVARVACSFRVPSSSRPTVAARSNFPSWVRRTTRPLGGSRR